MRKWLAAISVITIFLITVSTSRAATDGIKLGEFPKSSPLVHSLKADISKQVNQIIVLPNQQFDQAEAAGIINRISKLPYPLLAKIKKHGITLKLFTGKLTDNPTASQLKGKIPRGYDGSTTWDDVPGIGGSKVVLVKIGASEKGQGHGSINLELHELAHSIDHLIFNNISQKPAFNQIWEQEHNQLFPGNDYFHYPEEYFAETFAMYYLNDKTREMLQTNAPTTFNFIKNLN